MPGVEMSIVYRMQVLKLVVVVDNGQHKYLQYLLSL